MTVDIMQADVRRIIGAVCASMPGLSGDVRTFAHQWPYEIALNDPVVQRLIAAHAEVMGTSPEVTSGLPSGAFISRRRRHDPLRHPNCNVWS